MPLTCTPIGYFHTPHTDTTGMPIQPSGSRGVRGTIDVLPEYHEGLRDLEGFSHVIVLYHFHNAEGFDLTVTPFLDASPHGVFATRAPRRPNAIGLSVLQLNDVRDGALHLENVDVLDGTPVIDIKPYVPAFDHWDADRVGWLEKTAKDADTLKSDDRFGDNNS